MNTKNSITIGIIAALALTLGTGCQRKIASNQYNSATVGSVSETYQGVIVSFRKVQVSESDRLQDNSAGIGMGAVGGGLLGSAFGNGNGTLVGIGAGALIGGIAGAFAQEELGKQEAFEYTVKLANAKILQVTQGDDTPLSVGQRVFVSIGTGANRSRVIPDNSGMPMDAQPMSPLPGQSSPMVVINNSSSGK